MSTSSPHSSRSYSAPSVERASRSLARLPDTSPTVGFNWAIPMRIDSGIRLAVAPSRLDERCHLLADPAVSLLHAVPQTNRGSPAELLLDQRVLAAASADSLRGGEVVPAFELPARDVFDDVDQLVDRDQFVTPDVDRFDDIAGDQLPRAINAVVDVHEAAGLLAIPPHFDL